MKICFPIEEDNGLESIVYNHFGSAPMFVVVDTESREVSSIINRDAQHSHGACSPIKALNGQSVDAVVVGGIGGGALNKLTQAGVKVFKAKAGTIGENVDMFIGSELSEFSLLHVCGGHGGECSH